MSSTLASAPYKTNRPLFFEIRKMVTCHVELLDASSKLGVTLSTLRKILAGGPISHFIEKKIGRVLEGEASAPDGRKRWTAERLLEVYHLYEARRTLRGVAEALGLSYERVRQLLVKGSEFGLFVYKPYSEGAIPREKILDDYRRLLTLKGVARANRISVSSLHRLFKAHRIADAELKEIWTGAKRAICAGKYDAVVRQLGYHPSTTDLQRIPSARYLSTQIRRLWGSIEVFRSARNIPPPKRLALRRRRSPL